MLENAGYPAMGMTDKVGVYAGCGFPDYTWNCLLYTSDAADERSSVDLGGRRIIKKKKQHTT